MPNQYPSLKSIAEAPNAIQDDIRFRAGALTVRVVPVSDGANGQEEEGTTYFPTKFSCSFQENNIPTASIDIPVGRPIGTDVQESDDVLISVLRNDFRRFARIRVYVEVRSPQTQSEEIKSALQDGSYLVFSGRVNTYSYNRDNEGAMVFNISCQQRFLQLAAASSLFSPFMPDASFGTKQVFEGFNAIPPNPDLSGGRIWEAVVESIRTLFDTTKTEDFKKDPNISAVQDILGDSNDATLTEGGLIDEVESLLTLNISGDATGEKVGSIIFAETGQILSYPSILATTTRIGASLYYSTVMTADAAYVIPKWPVQPSDNVKVAPAGTFMYQSLNVGRNSERISDTPIVQVATVVYPGTEGGFFVEGDQKATVSNYVIPPGEFYDREFGIARIGRIPYWMQGATVMGTSKPENALIPGRNGTKSMFSPNGAENIDKGPSSDIPSLGNQGSQLAAIRYARFDTLNAFFSPNVVSVVSPLRFDVVPGHTLRCDQAQFSDIAELSTDESLFGYVETVDINIDAKTGTATTSFGLSYIRNGREQAGIADVDEGTGGIGHFCYEDHTAQWADVVLAERTDLNG